MKENKEFTGDMPEMEISKEERKQLEIENHLVSYNKALEYSKSPYVLMGYFLGVSLMLWTAFSFNANPRRILPMYDGLFDVLGNHLFFVFSQVFFLYILPFGAIMLITTIVFSQFKLLEAPELIHKLENGEDRILETAKKLQRRGRIRRSATIVVFLTISVFTMFSVGFRLNQVFIYDESDIQALTNADSGKRIILMNDITIEEDSSFSFYEFTGVFDGNGYTISGIEATDSLFGENYGVIANVHFEDIHRTGYSHMSILSSNNYGTIRNVSFNNVRINQIPSSRNYTSGYMAIFSMINIGVIQDVSINNVEYHLIGDIPIDLSGITMSNEGIIINAYTTVYTFDNDSNARDVCLISCPSGGIYDSGFGIYDGVIHNVKVDYLTLDAGLFEDDDYISCLGCIDDFNLDNQMYETPGTYWQIKHEDLSNEIPEYF